MDEQGAMACEGSQPRWHGICKGACQPRRSVYQAAHIPPIIAGLLTAQGQRDKRMGPACLHFLSCLVLWALVRGSADTGEHRDRV